MRSEHDESFVEVLNPPGAIPSAEDFDAVCFPLDPTPHPSVWLAENRGGDVTAIRHKLKRIEIDLHSICEAIGRLLPGQAPQSAPATSRTVIIDEARQEVLLAHATFPFAFNPRPLCSTPTEDCGEPIVVDRT